MASPVFMGDEWTAAGWRLAGLEVFTPAAGQSRDCLEAALEQSPPLVLVSAELADGLDQAWLRQLRERADPPVVVVGDAADRGGPDRLTRDVRRRMGVAE